MSIKQHLAPRQRVQFQAVGEFIYIERCPSELLIQTERGDYRFKQGAQVLDPNLSGLVTVENLGEAGMVEVIVGMGRYVPPSDGQKVAVEAMPAVKIASGQEVEISELPEVEIASGQEIEISEMPEVEIADGQEVAVNALPAIHIAAGQKLALESLPAVELADGQQVAIETLPAIKFAVGQKVEVEALPAVELAQNQQVTLTTASKLNIGASALPYAIDANPSRKAITLKAPKANTAAVSIDGFELDAGERLTLGTTAALNLTGAEGDNIQYIEVMQ